MKKAMIGGWALCLCLAAPLAAQQGLRTKSVSIFKDGTAFFAKAGTVQADSGYFRLTEGLPAALHGTFWVLSPQGKLREVTSRLDTVAVPGPAADLYALLAANKGKRLTLGLQPAGAAAPRALSGRLHDLLPDRTVVLRDDAGAWHALPAGQVASCQFHEAPELLPANAETKPVLEVAFNGKETRQPLELMYLQRGLSWAPNYLVELLEGDKARVTLRAEVHNEAEDLDGCEVSFVVGVPNFRYADGLSALVDFGFGMDAYRDNVAMANNSYLQQSYQPERRGAYDVSGGGMVPPDAEGSTAEDLYFYKLDGLRLPKGGRAHYTLLSATVPVAHRYEVRISGNSASPSYYQKQWQPTGVSNQVMHSVCLENTTPHPWTAGTALVMASQQGKPLSQDRLPYTPPTGSAVLPITVSPDIRVQDAEREVSREAEKQRGRDGQAYDLVTVEAEIVVKNYKAKAVELDVLRDVEGEPLRSDVDWDAGGGVSLGGGANRRAELRWKLKLAPGEERKITYTYRVYVRY